MDSLMQLFYDEANEMVEGMEQVLLALESGEPDPETVNALFRYAHSFKGNSAAMGFTHLSKFTHGLESAMEVLRKEQRTLTPELATLLLQAVDMIRTLLERTRTEGDVGDPTCEPLLQQINAVINGETPQPTAVPSASAPATPAEPPDVQSAPQYRITYQPAPTLSAEHDPLQLLSELRDYGQVLECRFREQIPPLEQLKTDACYGSWELLYETAFEPAIVRALLELVAEGAEVRIEPLNAPSSTETVQPTATETVVAAPQPSVATPAPTETPAATAATAAVNTAAKLGKKVSLEIEGEETELDRTLLEALSDPLTHLIRNAIDHGIEPPEERRQNGKPETGTIKLSAYQSEGRIYIEVSDDGRGIDTERVRQKAIQLGWITENDHPSEETLYDFIFQPGFSTAQQVSDLSGRGVGMDVVKRNVESLGGSISVQSKRGEGTRFLLRVPLTLAIMDGLGLTVADEHYIVPLTAVVEVLQYGSLKHTALFDQYEMVNVRGEFIPLVRLRQFVGLSEAESNQDELIVVLEQEDQRIALLIDGIAGQQQVVLKSLEENFVRVPGFAGATILGDGRVALILDVSDLIRRGRQSTERYAAVA